MSLLSTFLSNHLIPALEKAIENHEPEIQEMLLSEIHTLGQSVATWVVNKIEENSKLKGK